MIVRALDMSTFPHRPINRLLGAEFVRVFCDLSDNEAGGKLNCLRWI